MKVNIYGTDWMLKLVEPNAAVLSCGGGFAAGSTYQYTREIFISNGLNKDLMKETIAHELTHAVIDQMAFGKDPWAQEEVCRFMEKYARDILILTDKVYEEVLK